MTLPSSKETSHGKYPIHLGVLAFAIPPSLKVTFSVHVFVRLL